MPLRGFRVEQRSWVKPAVCANAAVTSVKLEPRDAFALREGMVQSITIFPKKFDAAALKSSLGQLLSSYPFLAGRAWQPLASLVSASPVHGWRVSGRQGVAFSVCSATGSAEEAYKELGDDSSRNAYNIVDLRNTWAIMWGVAPVMTVRITNFDCGGSALGVAVANGLVDDPGLREVLHEWFNGHVHGEWPDPPRLLTDRSTCLPSINPSGRWCDRARELFSMCNYLGWGIAHLVHFAPHRHGTWSYILGVALLALVVAVSLRPDPLASFLCCFFSLDMHLLSYTLGWSKSMGGTRIRIDLSAEEVHPLVGHDLRETHSGSISRRVAEAKLLVRMFKAVADIMRPIGEVQLYWVMDPRDRAENCISRSYIGPTLSSNIARVSAKNTGQISPAFQSLLENQGELSRHHQLREWCAALNSAPPKGMFLELGEPFVTCFTALGDTDNWTMLDSNWGAGKPLGVMAGNYGSATMCGVLSAPAGGVSLYFNLTGFSWILSFTAQSAPPGWVQRVQSPEFRERLLNPVELQDKRSRSSRVHPDTEGHNAVEHIVIGRSDC